MRKSPVHNKHITYFHRIQNATDDVTSAPLPDSNVSSTPLLTSDVKSTPYQTKDVKCTPLPSTCTSRVTSADDITPSAPQLRAADKVVTAADKVVTSADNVVTAADNVVTAADNVVKAADNVVTAADNVVTAADKVVTAADKVVTAADKEVTADFVQTAAEASSSRVQQSAQCQLPNDHTVEAAPTVNVGSYPTGDCFNSDAPARAQVPMEQQTSRQNHCRTNDGSSDRNKPTTSTKRCLKRCRGESLEICDTSEHVASHASAGSKTFSHTSSSDSDAEPSAHSKPQQAKTSTSKAQH